MMSSRGGCGQPGARLRARIWGQQAPTAAPSLAGEAHRRSLRNSAPLPALQGERIASCGWCHAWIRAIRSPPFPVQHRNERLGSLLRPEARGGGGAPERCRLLAACASDLTGEGGGPGPHQALSPKAEPAPGYRGPPPPLPRRWWPVELESAAAAALRGIQAPSPGHRAVPHAQPAAVPGRPGSPRRAALRNAAGAPRRGWGEPAHLRLHRRRPALRAL